jgi:hypothetical protein
VEELSAGKPGIALEKRWFSDKMPNFVSTYLEI